MISYPNQRIVTVNRNMPSRNDNKDKNPFILVYCSSVAQASKNIKGQVAFKLWLYFVSNQDGYKEAFSPQAIKDQLGVSLDSARDAFKQLVQKKYLVLDEGTKNKYQFFERPVNHSLSAIEVKKMFYDDETNTQIALTYKQLLTQVGNKKDADILWNNAKAV